MPELRSRYHRCTPSVEDYPLHRIRIRKEALANQYSKCDERAPCANCVRHQVQCSLAGGPEVQREDTKSRRSCASSSSNISRTTSAEAGSNVAGTHATSSTNAPPTSVPGSYTALTEPFERKSGSDWKLDLELMHHCMTQMPYLLTEHQEPEVFPQQWWIQIPRIALACDYLLHSLLGLCALHIAYLEPNRAPTLRMHAVEHYDKALMFRREDSGLAPSENAAAKFLFGWHVAFFAYAIPPSVAPIDGIATIFSLVRDTGSAISEVWYPVTQGPMGPLVGESLRAVSHGLAYQTHLPDGAEYALDALNFMLNNDDMTPEARIACELTLAELKQMFHAVQHDSDACPTATVMFFPQSSTDTFPALIRQRAPQALVILAYYCELLNILDTRWWMEGWGRRLLQDILANVDEPWRRWIERPVQTVLLKDSSVLPAPGLAGLV